MLGLVTPVCPGLLCLLNQCNYRNLVSRNKYRSSSRILISLVCELQVEPVWTFPNHLKLNNWHFYSSRKALTTLLFHPLLCNEDTSFKIGQWTQSIRRCLFICNCPPYKSQGCLRNLIHWSLFHFTDQVKVQPEMSCKTLGHRGRIRCSKQVLNIQHEKRLSFGRHCSKQKLIRNPFLNRNEILF